MCRIYVTLELFSEFGEKCRDHDVRGVTGRVSSFQEFLSDVACRVNIKETRVRDARCHPLGLAIQHVEPADNLRPRIGEQREGDLLSLRKLAEDAWLS